MSQSFHFILPNRAFQHLTREITPNKLLYLPIRRLFPFLSGIFFRVGRWLCLLTSGIEEASCFQFQEGNIDGFIRFWDKPNTFPLTNLQRCCNGLWQKLIPCFFRTINSYKSTVSIKSKGTLFTALQINFHSFLRLLVILCKTFGK